MKREPQTVEFKQSWHDECLKWICGFANAQGGKLTIGHPVGTVNVLDRRRNERERISSSAFLYGDRRHSG